SISEPVAEVSLFVTKKDTWYELQPQLRIGEKTYGLKELEIRYDYFVLLDGSIHFINDFSAIQAILLFPPGKKGLTLHESKFYEFRKTVLSKLEDKITVYYSFITAATEEQTANSNMDPGEERFIYLSELGDFIIIDPVM